MSGSRTTLPTRTMRLKLDMIGLPFYARGVGHVIRFFSRLGRRLESLAHMLVGKLTEGLPHPSGVLTQECKLCRVDVRCNANAPGPPEFWSTDFARLWISELWSRLFTSSHGQRADRRTHPKPAPSSRCARPAARACVAQSTSGHTREPQRRWLAVQLAPHHGSVRGGKDSRFASLAADAGGVLSSHQFLDSRHAA